MRRCCAAWHALCPVRGDARLHPPFCVQPACSPAPAAARCGAGAIVCTCLRTCLRTCLSAHGLVVHGRGVHADPRAGTSAGAAERRRHRHPPRHARNGRAGRAERGHAAPDRGPRRRQPARRAARRNRRQPAGPGHRRAQGAQPARHGQQTHAVPRRRPARGRQRWRHRPLGLPVRLDRGGRHRTHRSRARPDVGAVRVRGAGRCRQRHHARAGRHLAWQRQRRRQPGRGRTRR